MPTPHLNPYVGPRSFQPGEAIYGRDRELRDLAGLLIAERIVLLHSPSGAGKTSLVQAALIPRLQENDFNVLPIIRLGLDPPDEPGGGEPNRYIRSTIISLEDGLPPEEQLPLEAIGDLSLDDYLRGRDKRAGKRDTVLIFDQFEEILTIAPLAIEAKHAFFAQLGQALRDKRRWALFAMREEFVTRLEPFVRPVPTRFGSTFRLDLLDPAGALAAIQQPARAHGVGFQDEAARSLVDDLRRSQVQHPDGTIETQLGPTVEPVQLQVVCYRLWERLLGETGGGGSRQDRQGALPAPPAPPALPAASGASGPVPAEITPADVRGVGDLDRSLAEYYAERVAEAARQSGVAERTIREWFDRRLITPQGIRSQVLRGAEASEGLPTAAIRPLLEALLVRAEQRRGLTWFELAHDRMIDPVRQDNAAWFAANLSPLQRQADLWERQGRPEGLLLRDADLAEAEGWAVAHADILTPPEREFLEASRRLQAIILRARRQNRRIRWLAIIASAFSAVALIALVVAYQALQTAQREQRQAQARGLAAGATNQINSNPELALILAQQAALATRNAGEPVEPNAQTALYQALAASRVRQTWAFGAPGGGFALSPDGATLALGGADGAITLLNVADGRQRTLRGHNGAVFDLVFSPDGAWLASADVAGTVQVWDLAGGTPLRTITHPAPIRDLAFSPDGAALATAADDGVPRIWSLRDDTVRALPGHRDSATGVAFSPDGTQLVSVSRDTRAILFEIRSGRPSAEFRSSTGLTSVAFSPDGATIALVADGAEALLWQPGGDEPVALRGHTGQIASVAFAPGGLRLISAGDDSTARIWSDRGQPIGTLTGHSGAVIGAVFAPGGATAYTLANNGDVRAWDLGGLIGEPTPAMAGSPAASLLALGRPSGQVEIYTTDGVTTTQLTLSAGPITAVALAQRGALLAAVSADGQLALWRLPDTTPRWQSGPERGVRFVAFSPDDSLLFTVANERLTVWAAGAGRVVTSYRADGPITSIAVHPLGRQIALITEAGQLIIWDYTAGTATSGGDQAAVGPLAYRPDGGLLAMRRPEGGVLLLNAADLAPLPAAIAPDAQVAALAFSPDGGRLAVADVDGTITIWDIGDGAELLSIGEPGLALALFFSHDGSALMSNGSDGVLRSYPLDLDQALALAARHITRPPSAIECARYYLDAAAGC